MLFFFRNLEINVKEFEVIILGLISCVIYRIFDFVFWIFFILFYWFIGFFFLRIDILIGVFEKRIIGKNVFLNIFLGDMWVEVVIFNIGFS